MLTDDDVTQLQLAIEAQDLDLVRRLLSDQEAQDLESLQIFGNYTLLMYACQYGTADMVRLLTEQGVGIYELDWSDNNEVKSALRNQKQAEEILRLILPLLPEEVAHDMLTTNWQAGDESSEESETPIEMAQKLPDSNCLKILEQAIKAR